MCSILGSRARLPGWRAMGSSAKQLSYGWLSKLWLFFCGSLNIRCRTIIGIQKGPIILTTTYIGHIMRKWVPRQCVVLVGCFQAFLTIETGYPKPQALKIGKTFEQKTSLFVAILEKVILSKPFVAQLVVIFKAVVAGSVAESELLVEKLEKQFLQKALV